MEAAAGSDELQSGWIAHAATQPVADRGNGNRTIPMITPSCGTSTVINGITFIAPNSAIQEHFHNCEEAILILEGEAIAVIAGKEHRMQVPDVSWVPAGVPHYFRNVSDTLPLRIFWTYSRPDATRTSVATGETRPIAAEHIKTI
jgi:quercetin dioxygenase-like cupin family protein